MPIGVWIGLRPACAERVQPLAQFLAAFPANLLFPVVRGDHRAFHLNPNIWLTPLMILGTQWYILFNVIAGASGLPERPARGGRQFPRQAAGVVAQGDPARHLSLLRHRRDHRLGRRLERRIVAEVVSWGDTHLTAHGPRRLYRDRDRAGDFPRVVLGIAVMSLLVTLFNRLLWRPLYAFAERRLRLD